MSSRLSAKDCLRDDFVALFKDIMGIRITPHRARNILSGDAKRFGQLTGHDAWAIAFQRLGNHPLTVFHEHNELDVSAGPEFDAELDTRAAGRGDFGALAASLSPEERRLLLNMLLEDQDK